MQARTVRILFLAVFLSSAGVVMAESTYRSWDFPCPGPGSEYSRVAISGDGNSVITAAGREIHFFTKSSGKPRWIFKDGPDACLDLAISDDGELAAACGRKIMLFRRDSSEPAWVYAPEAPALFDRAEMSPDGRYLTVYGKKVSDGSGIKLLFREDSPVPEGSWIGENPSAARGDNGISVSSSGGDIVFGGKELRFREVPPEVVIEVEDAAKVYTGGSEFRLRAHISNPGKENVLNLGITLEWPGEEKVSVSEMPVVVDAHTDRDLDISFKMPPTAHIKSASAAKTKVCGTVYINEDSTRARLSEDTFIFFYLMPAK